MEHRPSSVVYRLVRVGQELFLYDVRPLVREITKGK